MAANKETKAQQGNFSQSVSVNNAVNVVSMTQAGLTFNVASFVFSGAGDVAFGVTTIKPSVNNTTDLGTSLLRYKTIYTADNVESPIFKVTTAAGTLLGYIQAGLTTPSGAAVGANGPSLTTFQVSGGIGIFTKNDATADATATTNLYLETGNKSTGTGDSGLINIQTGNSAGGNSGNIVIQSGTAVTGNTGNITIAIPSGGGSTGTISINTAGAVNSSVGTFNIVATVSISLSGGTDGVIISKLVLLGDTTQTLGATFTVSPNTSNIPVSSSADRTSNATTAISDGTSDGQVANITNIGSFNLTFVQGANIKLPAGTDYVLTPFSMLSVVWNSALSFWITRSASSN